MQASVDFRGAKNDVAGSMLTVTLGAARGYSFAVLSELLPAAEAGVVEVLWSDRVRGEGP